MDIGQQPVVVSSATFLPGKLGSGQSFFYTHQRVWSTPAHPRLPTYNHRISTGCFDITLIPLTTQQDTVDRFASGSISSSHGDVLTLYRRDFEGCRSARRLRYRLAEVDQRSGPFAIYAPANPACVPPWPRRTAANRPTFTALHVLVDNLNPDSSSHC
jgi:hypothetical protein